MGAYYGLLLPEENGQEGGEALAFHQEKGNFVVGKRSRALSPTRIIALTFAGIILLGSLLLMLPGASRNGVSCGFRPALFTATSATCVTGLVLYALQAR